MNAFKKPVKCLFLIYFMMNSLVFFGQDLTVRKNTDRSWCIAIAEHCHTVWERSGIPMDSLGHSSQSCSHKHQGNEVHICVDHHKFLHSPKTPGLPGTDTIRSFSMAHFNESDLYSDYLRPLPLTTQGHDPGLVPYEAAISSVLLI